MAKIMTASMNLAMRMEGVQVLGADHDERTAGRRGYANRARSKLVDEPVGTLSLEVPGTTGTGERCDLQALAPGLPSGPTPVSRRHAGALSRVAV